MARGDKRDDDDAPVEKPQKKSNKMLIIGITLLIALAGVAVGTVLYLKGNSGEAAQPSEGETQDKKKQPPVIYALEPFVVNIRDNNETRYLKIKIELGVAEGKEVKAELDPYLPQVRDAILMLLTSKSLSDLQDIPGKQRLRQEVLSTMSRILPRGKVKEVFFTDFVVQ